MTRNRSFILLCVASTLQLGCGVSKLEEKWPASPAGSPTKTSCARSPLRVAVLPSTDGRKGTNDDAASSLGAMYAVGALYSPEVDWTTVHDGTSIRTANRYFTHDELRLHGMSVYRALAASGCFEQVSFEPLHADAYDLLVEATLTRVALRSQIDARYVPFYFGVMLAAGSRKRATHIDADIAIRVPGRGAVLSFSTDGDCAEEACAGAYANGLAPAFDRAAAEVRARLASYVSARGEAHLRDLVAARTERRRRAIDAAYAEQARASREAPEADRPAADRRLAQTRALLDALIEIEDTEERAWSQTSDERITAELDASNRVAHDRFHDVIAAAVVAGIAARAQAKPGQASGLPLVMETQQRVEASLRTVEAVRSTWERARAIISGQRVELGDTLTAFAALVELEPVARRKAWVQNAHAILAAPAPAAPAAPTPATGPGKKKK